MINTKEAINWGTQKLSHLMNNPKLETEVLLAEVLKCDRVKLKTDPWQKLSFWQNWKFKNFVKKRSCHIPVAQIFGYKDWAGFKVLVNKHVLIPRDETEILVNEILKSENPPPQKVLDIGTGSGNIAIFLKKNWQFPQITAVDISKKALKIAKKNAGYQNLIINFKLSDLLQNIPNNSFFDLIVANLPYVPKNLEVTKDLAYEPQNAIFSGKDGLDTIRKLAKELTQKNIKFKTLWLEFLPKQKYAIAKIFEKFEIEFIGDLGGDIFFAKISEK